MFLNTNAAQEVLGCAMMDACAADKVLTLDIGDFDNERDKAVFAAMRVLRGEGKAVTLTPREYAILEYLALHRGEVVTRTELYEHLFDDSDDSLSNLLDVHVFSIRKKLGAELIATRRGVGYCVRA